MSIGETIIENIKPLLFREPILLRIFEDFLLDDSYLKCSFVETGGEVGGYSG
jgi:hypothetical protein